MRRRAALAMLLLPAAARAAPPPGADPDGPVGRWIKGLRDWNGESCCGVADCRPTALRQDENGHLYAWIGRDEFGPGAPDAWVFVPDMVRRGTKAHGPAPGARSWACWNGHDVICVAEGGTS